MKYVLDQLEPVCPYGAKRLKSGEIEDLERELDRVSLMYEALDEVGPVRDALSGLKDISGTFSRLRRDGIHVAVQRRARGQHNAAPRSRCRSGGSAAQRPVDQHALRAEGGKSPQKRRELLHDAWPGELDKPVAPRAEQHHLPQAGVYTRQC